jgi:hypothetical protein
MPKTIQLQINIAAPELKRGMESNRGGGEFSDSVFTLNQKIKRLGIEVLRRGATRAESSASVTEK